MLEKLMSETLLIDAFVKAIYYVMYQRDPLYRYIDDCHLKPDSNIDENAIRPLALGQLNWLLDGCIRRGQAAALLYRLFQSRMPSKVNPSADLINTSPHYVMSPVKLGFIF